MNMLKDNTYKINTSIPGWNGSEILYKLAEYASKVPENGHILELGALFGRSTYALGHNKHESVRLYVFELWPTLFLDNHKVIDYHDGRCSMEYLTMIKSKYKSDPDRLEGDDFYKLWQHFTSEIPNLHSYIGRTTDPNDNYPMMDLIFHDAGHTAKDLQEDLSHWLPKLKPDGIIIIDDYERFNFSDLCDGVDSFVSEHNLSTEMVTGRNILLRRK